MKHKLLFWAVIVIAILEGIWIFFSNNHIKELKTKDLEITFRLQRLEETSALLGDTLEICEVVPKAYHKFAPDSGLGLESELNRCVDSYYKLRNRF